MKSQRKLSLCPPTQSASSPRYTQLSRFKSSNKLVSPAHHQKPNTDKKNRKQNQQAKCSLIGGEGIGLSSLREGGWGSDPALDKDRMTRRRLHTMADTVDKHNCLISQRRPGKLQIARSPQKTNPSKNCEKELTEIYKKTKKVMMDYQRDLLISEQERKRLEKQNAWLRQVISLHVSNI